MIEEFEPGTAEAAECLRFFKAYVKRAWQEVDPAPLKWGWHLDAITEHLQAVAEGDIRKLVINIPPGFGKSLLVTTLWPTWVWARNPKWSLIGASHDADLAVRFSTKARELMLGDWYTKWFRGPNKPFVGEPWGFATDANRVTYYRNTQKGERFATGVGGKGTGLRGEALIIDDPMKALAAHSKAERETVIKWKTETMANRFNDMEKAQQVLVMQRLHTDDLSGFLIRQGGWEHLRLPAKFEPNEPCRTKTWRGADFWKDPRKEAGELLFEAKFPLSVLDDLKKEVGSFGFAGQYQQRPVPEEGGMFKREWFSRRWVLPGTHAPAGFEVKTVPLHFDQLGIFTDAAFKAQEDSDRVAIGVFGTKGADVFLLQLAWDRMEFTETVRRLVDLKNKWPKVSGIYVEDKANGTAVMNLLKGKLPGLIPIEPEGGKEARVASISPFVEAGNLWLPLYAPWVDDYISEACAFPKAPNDDAIDMTACALIRYCNRKMTMLEALTRLENERVSVAKRP